MHYRIFNSIPGIYLLNDIAPPLLNLNLNVFRNCQMSPDKQDQVPHLKTTGLH